MEQTQKYIGTQNGVVICVEQNQKYAISGNFFHSYSPDAVDFRDLYDLACKVEVLFDDLNYPYPNLNFRSFGKESRMARRTEPANRMIPDEELLEHSGEICTFILRVQHRQNTSWQGRLTWVEKDKTLVFHSVWELLCMIEEAVESTAPFAGEAVTQ